MPIINIEGRKVGKGNKAFLIAEAAQSHQGDIRQAHAYIDAVAEAGFDAVKFQTHIARFESTYDEPFRAPIKGPYKTRYDYWRAMEFTAEQWVELRDHAKRLGLVFLSTPFSLEAFQMLNEIGMAAWKAGSGEVGSMVLIGEMAKTGKPILLSTGMSQMSEIAMTAERLAKAHAPFALLQCSSIYPTPLKDVGLNVIDSFRQSFDCPIGLSDHSGLVFPGLAAMARGADLLEVHVVLEGDADAPDAKASLTVADLCLIRQARDATAEMLANPVDKDEMASRLCDLRAMFGKSLAVNRNLAAGTVIESFMLGARKPGTGIPCEKADELVGKRLARDVTPERLLQWNDIKD